MRILRRRGGAFARRQARERYLQILRDGSIRIALVLAVFYAAIVGLHLLVPHRFGGVLFGITLAIPAWAVTLAVVTDPSATAWAQGAEAEDWTSIELRRALGANAVVVDDVQSITPTSTMS